MISVGLPVSQIRSWIHHDRVVRAASLGRRAASLLKCDPRPDAQAKAAAAANASVAFFRTTSGQVAQRKAKSRPSILICTPLRPVRRQYADSPCAATRTAQMRAAAPAAGPSRARAGGEAVQARLAERRRALALRRAALRRRWPLAPQCAAASSRSCRA